MPPSAAPSSDQRASTSVPGTYILRSLLADIPLSEDGAAADELQITCVEFWNDNLYIGTSAAELLHYVQIPGDPSDARQDPTFILASRLKPVFSGSPPTADAGVQQILILPDAGKASILCNGTATFYSLPELTPAYGSSVKIANCSWIGGVDLADRGEHDGDESDSTFVMACQKNRIRLVRIGQKPQTVKEIMLPGIVATVRRGDIACAANPRSYSLIDVDAQETMPLFDITSEPPPMTPIEAPRESKELKGEPEQPSDTNSDLEKSDSSLEADQAGTQKALPDLPEEPDADPTGAAPSSSPSSPAPAPSSGAVEASPPEQKTAKEAVEPAAGAQPRQSLERAPDVLRPHIVSPSDDRFLLTMGTSLSEPGIGMYVNLDGDVVPPSLEFTRYPLALAVDGFDPESDDAPPGVEVDGKFLFAVIDVGNGDGSHLKLEIQKCASATESDSTSASKEFLSLEGPTVTQPPTHVGLREAQSSQTLVLSNVVQILRSSSVHLRPSRVEQQTQPDRNKIQARERSGTEFISRLSTAQSRVLVWNEDSVWAAARTPVLLQLDAKLEAALLEAYDDSTGHVDRRRVEEIMAALQGQDPRSELEFVSFSYLRQKASLLLFISLASQTCNGIDTFDQDRRLTEDALIAGEVDPRVILALLPKIRDEVVTDDTGIWIPMGLVGVVQSAYAQRDKLGDSEEATEPFLDGMLVLVKNYLQYWRQKKGFGSIDDEVNIFKSVDAALLHILLLLDMHTTPGPAREGSVRQELNSLVDRGVDCPARAVELLEEYQRLYVLSRFYQGRKSPTQVLSTWQRILDGAVDRGGEFADGEEGLRRYLGQIKDRAIVEQYGSWLAKRNPELGVHVFTESNSRVRFAPDEAISILRERAPEAVQHLLEHLVFDKHLPQHANDLIAYYLDSVLGELAKNQDSQLLLRETYQDYRALPSPKPTYSQFIASTSVEADWWRDRLRLLQLLGGSHGAASQYDIPAIIARIESYKDELVPEMIILGGRQGRHREAIRLLTHGLGDYDTAIRYCVRGGSGTYSTTFSSADGGAVPSHVQQRELFDHLLAEFFRIKDPADRIAQTSELLERFAGWFDISQVIDVVPDDWSVEQLSGFLENAFRQLVTERHDTAVTKALVSSQNLSVNAGLVEKLESLRAVVDSADAAAQD